MQHITIAVTHAINRDACNYLVIITKTEEK